MADDAFPGALPLAAGSSGTYHAAGSWSVFLPREASHDEALMVSQHEAWHGFLTLTTAWGSVMNLVATATPERDHLIAELVDAARQTQEVVATAFGIWGSNYDPAGLVTGYPGYDDYYALALAIAPSRPPNSMAKRVAVYAFCQVCMQPPVAQAVLEHGWNAFTFSDIPAAMLPDRRFSVLAGAYEDLGWGAIDLLLTQWPDAHERDLTAEAIDEFQRRCYEEFATALAALGHPVLPWQAHLEHLRPLVDVVRADHPNISVISVPDPSAANSADVEVHLRTMGESVTTTPRGLRAVVRPLAAGSPPLFVASTGEGAYYSVTVVRPLRRVLGQYAMTADERALLISAARDGISVTMRGLLPDGTVDIRPVAGAGAHLLLTARRPAPEVIVCSTSALERETTDVASLIGPPGAPLVMLFDTPPDATLRRWRDEGRPIRWSGGWMVLRQARVYCRVFAGEDAVPWVAFVSPATAGRLHEFAMGLWGADAVVPDVHELLGTLQGMAAVHVADTEPRFDFRGAFDYDGPV